MSVTCSVAIPLGSTSQTQSASFFSPPGSCAYKALYIDVIASAKDRDRLTNLLEKPPEFTSEKLQEHFGTYVFDVRFHILKGLAEAFCGLSDEFKSHSKVRVGKKGQVKRIILKYVMTQYGYMHGYGSERFFDVLNALNVFEGKPHMTGEERLKISEACHKEGEAEYNGLKIKVFANGNAHVHFTEEKMNNINRALAEFYGDILPDAESEEPTQAAEHRRLERPAVLSNTRQHRRENDLRSLHQTG